MIVNSARPTVAEIDLRALRGNYRALARGAEGGRLMAVVKADAYGHGAAAVARALTDEGCADFGVATVEEARELRQSGLSARIYLIAGFFAEQAREIVALGATPLINDPSLIAPLEAAAARAPHPFKTHLVIDSGMTRLGVPVAELAEAIEKMRRAPHLALEGVCTQLASAEAPDSPMTGRQLAEFGCAIEALGAAGFSPAVRHAANSAALMIHPEARFTMARPGIALYGAAPAPAMRGRLALRPVMTFKTRVMQLKRVPAGRGVGYGPTFVTSRESAIGVLPVGYADGYRRGLQSGGAVLIRGRRAPIVGAVCMDLTMVDLTGVPGAAVGDDAILWGGAGAATIEVDEIARLCGTIAYEMLCAVGRRVPRVYAG